MDKPSDIASVLKDVRRRFEQAGFGEAAQDARVLVSGILGLSATELILHDRQVLSAEECGRIEVAVKRRLAGEPVYRILGERSFYGLNFKLSADTLEPRLDTEILVDAALEAVGDNGGHVRILDLGIGTGAIILSLLHALPKAHGVGCDISEGAVATAQENAERLGLSARFEARISNWFENVEGRFDLIVSNPPYIESDEIEGLAPEVRQFDPRAALDGGPDGLAPYRAIAQNAAGFLNENGFVAVEIGWQQRIDVSGIFTESGFVFRRCVKDLGGHDRVLLFGL
ncbi:peptide chain release factor N(5)-glutamine methyltransferase [Rhizobium sp. L1K21]|uniref:peptide chain release factor N(5)-glutamine methyltransferase n=1 Tax=Rhizobium sp. L1K21 TaxID=2954933 RepID=UPI002092ED5E|nr:peptide chain release factor N(5)-glutamine methyltransferase [Rhizobium sp. L1K21]MCO6188212.1 peptide chain release factor N(5)-glutamine methyltransferase [Rhizobium sp. L1K21]